jgi:sortase A
MDGLFPDEPEQGKNDSYVLPRNDRRIEPGDNPAVELIRRKIDNLYGTEPNAREEIREAKAEPNKAARSKHQQYMYELSTSGKSLSEIQAEWHTYYLKLPDHEKREVWEEFYAANGHTPSAYTRMVQSRSETVRPHAATPTTPATPAPVTTVAPTRHPAVHHNLPHRRQAPISTQLPVIADSLVEASGVPGGVVVSEHERTPAPHRKTDHRTAAGIHKKLMQQVRASNSAQIKAKQHLQSLAFGLGVGALVIIVFLFSFFNEVIIAPFIQPSSHAEATPIILTQGSAAPSSTPEVIIPKINVQLPNVYSDSVKEEDIQDNLEDGVVHYASTSVPGQQGNAAFFGHSSNNIFNKGKYKFAFVLLHELVPGDLFYLSYNGKLYTYRVFQKQVVQPTDTWVLKPVEGKTATATLITCDPPGTSLHRLVVWGEQIDPDPNGNVAVAPAATTTAQPQELSSNGPSLLGRFWHWATPW